jgi:hypothetical protein
MDQELVIAIFDISLLFILGERFIVLRLGISDREKKKFKSVESRYP